MDKMLIVDDEKEIVSFLKDYFEGEGFQVLTAYNGLQAIEQSKQALDIILLDINMPGMDGLKVCGAIRNQVNCPIIFLTARVDDSDKIDKEVTYYLDSGLALDASILVVKNILKDLGIEEPMTYFDPNAVGGGGKGMDGALIEDFGNAGIGAFIYKKNKAEYDPGMTSMYWESAYIKDAMLSHNYLRNYRWTIDFINMKMYLVK